MSITEFPCCPVNEGGTIIFLTDMCILGINLGVGTKQWIPTKGVVEGTRANHAI